MFSWSVLADLVFRCLRELICLTAWPHGGWIWCREGRGNIRVKIWVETEPFRNNITMDWLKPIMKLPSESLESRVHSQPTGNANQDVLAYTSRRCWTVTGYSPLHMAERGSIWWGSSTAAPPGLLWSVQTTLHSMSGESKGKEERNRWMPLPWLLSLKCSFCLGWHVLACVGAANTEYR